MSTVFCKMTEEDKKMSKPWKPSVRVRADSKWRGGVRLERPAFEAQLSVEIDWDGLARLLAAKAANNKNGKSAMLGGLIKAKLVNDVPKWASSTEAAPAL
jgi:hypothetical protein